MTEPQNTHAPDRFVLPAPPLNPYSSTPALDIGFDFVPPPQPPYAPHAPHSTLSEATTEVPLRSTPMEPSRPQKPPKIANSHLPLPPTMVVQPKKFWGHFIVGLFICVLTGVLGFFGLCFLKFPRQKRFYALGGGIGFIFHVLAWVTIGMIISSRPMY